jgi:desulfoferrodoxin-like iron-binding protein
MDLKKNDLSRREFLNTAAIGAAVMAAAPIFKLAAKEEPKKTIQQKLFVCEVCGHVEFGFAPDACPICHAPKEKFMENNTLFADAMKKFPDAGISHDPVITVKKESGLISDLPCKEVSVRVGKKMHPMEEAHHIKFIDFYIDDKFLNRIFLNLQEYPAVSFYTKAPGTKVRMVEVCSVHGYWQAEAMYV